MSHDCPKQGCTKRVEDGFLSCSTHWFTVSRATRNEVWEALHAYGKGSPEHTAAISKAVTEMNERGTT